MHWISIRSKKTMKRNNRKYLFSITIERIGEITLIEKNRVVTINSEIVTERTLITNLEA